MANHGTSAWLLVAAIAVFTSHSIWVNEYFCIKSRMEGPQVTWSTSKAICCPSAALCACSRESTMTAAITYITPLHGMHHLGARPCPPISARNHPPTKPGRTAAGACKKQDATECVCVGPQAKHCSSTVQHTAALHARNLLLLYLVLPIHHPSVSATPCPGQLCRISSKPRPPRRRHHPEQR